jgi:hypothetical protein
MANPILCANKEFSNAGLYLTYALQSMNGRKVHFTSDEKSISFVADENEAVHEVWYQDPGNGCRIEPGDEKTICKVGEEDCCAFLTLGSNGFECQKFSELCATLLDRIAKETIRARRIGNCKVVGRIKNKTPTL